MMFADDTVLCCEGGQELEDNLELWKFALERRGMKVSRAKGKICRTCVRPAMLYGMETVPVTRFQETKMDVAEIKMLRFSLGLTRKNRIRNEKVREVFSVGRSGGKAREWRLRWFDHVRRRGAEYVGDRMLGMKPPGKRKRGRPKRRYMDTMNEDLVQVGVTEMDVQDRLRWRRMIRCGDP
ncbi:uncharacterized protein LOC134765277 [Penaeus indicus]|uniref:uncharacterized protein LOC134765277 n=1 Tax=Penaeus indicus TaxID=29960 RepID=UPI00300CD4E3